MSMLLWAIRDHDEDLVALVQSMHFVPSPDVLECVRKALHLYPLCSLSDITNISVAEWNTWMAFKLAPVINIHTLGTEPDGTVAWQWEIVQS